MYDKICLGPDVAFAAVDEPQSLEGFPPRVCVGDYPYVNNGAKPCRERERESSVYMCACSSLCAQTSASVC